MWDINSGKESGEPYDIIISYSYARDMILVIEVHLGVRLRKVRRGPNSDVSSVVA